MEFECNQTEQKLDTFHLQIPKDKFGKNLDIAKKLQSKAKIMTESMQGTSKL